MLYLPKYLNCFTKKLWKYWIERERESFQLKGRMQMSSLLILMFYFRKYNTHCWDNINTWTNYLNVKCSVIIQRKKKLNTKWTLFNNSRNVQQSSN